VRILDHANAASALAENILSALNGARKSKASVVGPLEAAQFNELSAWCREVGLTNEGEIVEAAVRASG